MKKKFPWLLAALLFGCMLCIYSQPYQVTITSQGGYKYYGDYAGIVYTPSFVIGPYNNPFTLSVVAIDTQRYEYGCGGLSSTNGFYVYRYGMQLWYLNSSTEANSPATLTADSANPQATARGLWSQTLTGDGYFNMSNKGIIAWFCPPAFSKYIGDTFTAVFKLFYNDLGLPIPSDLNATMDICYDASIIRLNSITSSSGTNLLSSLDTAQPGIVRVPNFNTAGLGSSTFSWTVIDDADTKITVNFYNTADKSPVVINTNTLAGYNTTVRTRKQFYHFGDADGNDVVNIVDALKVANFYVGTGPVSFEKAAADVNLDNQVDIVDALIIAKYYVGLVPALPL